MLDTCPCCGREAEISAGPYPASVSQRGALGLSMIRACESCGLHFASPLPSQATLDDFYAGGEYWDKLAPPTRVQGAHAYSQSVVRCSWIAHRITSPPLQMADIGAGQGWMSLVVGETWGGHDLCYDFLEPDDNAAATILQSGMQSVRRRLDTLPTHPEYDLIFLNQVLEHTVEPLLLLRGLKAGLKPGGYLYIEIPHRDDCFKDNVFPHMLFIDATVLERLCTLAGMDVVVLEAFGNMPSEGGLKSKIMRAGFLLAASFGLRQLASFLDRKIWGYSPRTDGIWLRALVKNPGYGSIEPCLIGQH
jgi:SAM-dependent methyltransferase